MNTQSHFIVNLFLLRWLFPRDVSRVRNFNGLVFLGSVLPDLPMFFFFFFYTFLVPTSQSVIWDSLYFDPVWQALFNVFNSVPIFAAVALFAFACRHRGLLIFSVANLLHFVGDFFVHTVDAHAHFYLLSNYKFISAVSYWDPSAFGHIFSVFEIIIVLFLSILMFRKIKVRWVRVLLVLFNVLNLSGFLLWTFIFRFL